jgi:hypothetical protein
VALAERLADDPELSIPKTERLAKPASRFVLHAELPDVSRSCLV